MPSIKQVVQSLVKELFDVELEEVSFEFPKEIGFGDVALPLAMQLAKPTKKNPREVAEALAKALEAKHLPEVTSVTVAGPGFINITYSDQYLLSEIAHGFASEQDANHELTIIVEYGSENIAKSMTVGHLRSNIIGQACANMYRRLGWNVVADNHLGDWGLQFGKLIVAYELWGDKATVEADPINELVKLYVRFHEEEEKDPLLTDRAREEFTKLEQGDEKNKQLWRWFYDESMKEFRELHAILDIHHDTELGESFYTPWLAHIVELCKEKGIVATADDGALYIDFGKEKPPFYILKKDGSTLYSTRDLATIEYRLTQYANVKRMVYFVDYSQKLHFDSLFATAKMLGLFCHFTLAGFGLIRLPEGKMSTRKGNAVYLRHLINEGIERAEQVLTEKGVDIQGEERAELAKTLALGAIKFNDLVHTRTGDIVFTWDTALNFEGDTATYLQYTYARIKSVLRKGEHTDVAADGLSWTLPIEHQILSLLARFPVIVGRAAESYQPHLLAQYLLSIAGMFNQFYNDVQVLKADTAARTARLYLLAQVAHHLADGLGLLGIKVPERM